ncbi:MAG: hypothetical protein M3478_07560 [Planctomycetota bacterium]|nr:hypothetical protein [Planctomycetota bacterium]
MMRDTHVSVAALIFGLYCVGCASRPVDTARRATQTHQQKEAFAGTWSGSLGCMPSLRTFAADGTYVESLLGHSETGTWEFGHGQLTLSIRGRSSVWSVIRQDDETVELTGNDLAAGVTGDQPRPWKWRRIPLTTHCIGGLVGSLRSPHPIPVARDRHEKQNRQQYVQRAYRPRSPRGDERVGHHCRAEEHQREKRDCGEDAHAAATDLGHTVRCLTCGSLGGGSDRPQAPREDHE